MHAPELRIAAAVAAHFGGDADLYRAFAAACAEQFPRDAARGDTAAAARDTRTLRRLAHDLGSALLLLGHDEARLLAGEVEASAQTGQLDAARCAWNRLSRELVPRSRG